MKHFLISTLFFFITNLIIAQLKVEVYFDFDRYDLNSQATQTLNSWIAEGKNYKVTQLFGFCDWKGTNAYNDTLALRRVNSVYNFLIKQNIKVEKNLVIRGFGEDFKQSPKQEENRRVTLIYEEILPQKEVEKPLPKSDAPTFKEQIKTAKKGDAIRLEHINFLNHSAKIVPNSEPVLLELLCVMEENPTLKIEIQGHICCDTENKYGYISEARARAVYTFLLRNKVNRKRISFKGYGATRPIYPIPEQNSQQEDANRRVEILILER